MTESPGKAQPGFRVLLEGPAGTGKTHAIRTLVEAGIVPFVLFTEPSMNVVGNIPCPKLHYAYARQATSGWAQMVDIAERIANTNNDDLQKGGKGTGVGLPQWLGLLRMCNNFKCDRCGQEFGDVEKWNTDRALVVDGLTGISQSARALVAGFKPILSQPDWGVAMTQIDTVIRKLKTDLQCHFILIGHIEPEKDEVTGGVKNYPSTLGRKLGPIIPTYFQDVILCYNDASGFWWTTAATQTDTVGRNLPRSAKLPPSFVPLVENWKKSGGVIVASN